jgi:hypothetical protein
MTNYNELSELDKAWADVYWTFQEEAFDLTDDHIGHYTTPVPLLPTQYLESYEGDLYA